MNMKSLLGVDIQSVKNIEEDHRWAISLGFSFVFANIYTSHERNTDENDDSRTDKLSAPNFLQTNDSSIINGVVGKISSWIDLDNELESFRKKSEKALLEELEWASFQGFPAVLIRLKKKNNTNLARVLTTFMSNDYLTFRIWIGLPMIDETEYSCVNGNNIPQKDNSPISWWRQFSILLGDSISNFMLMLALPKSPVDQNIINHWYSEPIAALETRTDIYFTNKKGFPVLSVEYQDIINRFLKMKIQLVLTGDAKNLHGHLAYRQYLSWIWTNKCPMTVYEKHSKDMEDYLQDPLQPLADHLPSSTYSIFELDPYKYAAYEKATFQAINDLIEKRKQDGEVNINNTKSFASIVGGSPNLTLKEKITIMVLGAGRGPLVDSAFKAADSANCEVKMYIVEKNPNAVSYLTRRITSDWNNRDVELFAGDMREVLLPTRADIFVSELLGSFGDNELSPECLDGAQHFLKPDGISIPQSYTSYIAPLQSTKLFSYMSTQRPPRYSKKTKYASLETPYVVRLLNCHLLAPVQSVFTFEHPKPDINASNDRYRELVFKVKEDGVIHGFAGFFHCILYKNVTMSIHPDMHSPDMFSWFPIVFPIIKPIQIKADSELSFHIWRVGNSKAVWYEWACTNPEVTSIHNPNGRSYSMSLLSK
uniref:Protein arginine N-methyltransferase n=1 Tax=Schmidtea mediterranea TaxID=79327 RepID=H2ESD8_SCHMD|nr:protein arginine methyltransferase 5-like protein [Schmidtea mediterranea]